MKRATVEHQLVSITRGATTIAVDAPVLTVHVGPGAGEQVRLTMRRYAMRRRRYIPGNGLR